MNLLLGQRVSASDGPLGEIADILLDSDGWAVAHLVVRPDECLTCLLYIPYGLVRTGHLVPVVALTASQAMQLRTMPPEGVVSVVPSEGSRRVATRLEDRVVTSNPVRSIDGDYVGRVHGIVCNDGFLAALLVRCGDFETGPVVKISMSDIDAIRSGRINLYIDARTVANLADNHGRATATGLKRLSLHGAGYEQRLSG